MKELKKGACHKLPRSRAPKHLWDNCLEMEAYIRFNNVHDIYKLDGEVPKTVMLGETSGISQFCELEWFKWVMFRNETPPFPDNMLKLGHFLGPSIDIGPAMTTKFLMESGQVLYRSTHGQLTPDLRQRQDRYQRRVHGQSL